VALWTISICALCRADSKASVKGVLFCGLWIYTDSGERLATPLPRKVKPQLISSVEKRVRLISRNKVFIHSSRGMLFTFLG
jgi:hypothetical protein